MFSTMWRQLCDMDKPLDSEDGASVMDSTESARMIAVGRSHFDLVRAPEKLLTAMPCS